ncbi:MAG: DEAD/DEAH box helicase [Flavihumibacter sp.]
MKFAQYAIDPAIKESLEALGFRKPTDIQYKAIPSILKGEDVLAIAQTGTGKTAAFVIPVLERLLRKKRGNRLRCLVMVPTRELAVQIATVFRDIARHTGLKVLGLFGGVEQDPQIGALRNGVDILVATPGRLFDLVHQGHLVLDRVEVLVLDEADHMLDLGFLTDINDLVRKLPTRRQTLFFSATINDRIKELAYRIVKKPIRIPLSPKDPVSKNVDHAFARIEMDDKRFFLEKLLKERPEAKVLVFVRTKLRADRVSAAMLRVGIESLVMHSGKEQSDRLQVLNRFREGQSRLLITTDVNARGIDIPDVDYVVNYDLPDHAESYVHRVGRTGRGVKRGEAISFVSPEEQPLLDAIEAYTGTDIKERNIDKESYRLTIAETEDTPHDNWRKLLEEAAVDNKKRKKKA